jgi:Na+-driven multidrug efflux pump
VIGVTAFVLVFVAAMQPVNGVVFVLDGLLIGAGDLRYLAVAMLVPSLVFVGLAIGVLAEGLGLGWLWAALYVFMVGRMLGLGWRWIRGGWAVTGAAR